LVLFLFCSDVSYASVLLGCQCVERRYD
jgi:hypothetical protein